MLQADLFDAPSFLESLPDPEGWNPYGLRWYQEEAFDRALASLEVNRASLVVMATGLGKSVLARAVVAHWDGPVLLLAHRDELIQQLKEHVARATGEYIEVEKAEETSSTARVVVGSVQSVCQKGRLARLGKDRFSLIIVDEAHHCTAASYRRVLDYFASAKVLGITATPDRGDGKALGKIFDDVPYLMDIWDGVQDGHLVPVHGGEIFLEDVQLDDIKQTAGDFQQGALDEAMRKAAHGIVTEVLKRQPHTPALAFFPGVLSASYAAELFNREQPGSTAFVCGETDRDERRVILRDFRDGRIQRVCNCGVLTEGFDAPTARLIIQARPTKSRALQTQICGRGTRPLPGLVEDIPLKHQAEERRARIAASTKPHMTIYDCVGNCRKLALRRKVQSWLDVLGGNFSDKEREKAKKLAEERPGDGGTVLLQDARKLLQEAAARTQARVTARFQEFNPFEMLDIPEEDDRITSEYGFKLPTPGQLEVLRRKLPKSKWGILPQLSRREATRLIDECIRRQKRGEATPKQQAQLERWGITDKHVGFAQASQALDYIYKQKREKLKVDPGLVDRILHRQREPGED